MVSLTNRHLKAQRTKKRILETALSLFSQKGYDNVTVDEIVLKSNTSKGAFYGHFRSKYEIFLEKYKEIDSFYKKFIKDLPKDMSAQEKITRLTVAQMFYLRDELGKELMRTIYLNALTPNSHNYLSDDSRDLYLIINDFLKEGQETGELTEGFSRKELTLIISRCMRGTVYDWFIFGSEFDLIKEIEKLIAVVFEGIKTTRTK